MQQKIKIGTRGSKLALWQANYTKDELAKVGVESELVIIKTKGDQIQHLSFDKLEGKGFFTKELEDALLEGRVDMAVHSMKDMPTTQPDGLCLTAVSYRENPADWLIINKSAVDNKLLKVKANAVIGTSSARRKAQMLDFRPDLQIKDIRGNVPTRLRKLADGEADAILLAAAGLTRLNLDLSEFEVVKLNPKEFVPAPAQGVLAFQTRIEDIETRKILLHLHNTATVDCTNVERKALQLLQGGCQMPMGAYCERDAAGHYHAYIALAETWEGPVKFGKVSSSTTHNLAESLLKSID